MNVDFGIFTPKKLYVTHIYLFDLSFREEVYALPEWDLF